MPKSSRGFTIVELLIVIVVIAILTAISLVAFNGLQGRAKEGVVQADLNQAAKQLAMDKVTSGALPATTGAAAGGQGLRASTGTTYQYTVDAIAGTYCLTATNGDKAYYTTGAGSPTQGACAGHTAPGGGGGGGAIADGSTMQTITAANCPSTRTRAVDARDNHTYWVQKLADGKCWMLTNLGYAGGGMNTHSDVKTLTDNSSGGAGNINTIPTYAVAPGVNYTTEPANPSTATDGSGQYGYLYNWCGAMGGQATSACLGNTRVPTPDTTISICPSGWRLPTGGASGELAGLNTAINGSTNDASAVNALRTVWLAAHSGSYSGGHFYGGGMGGYNSYYWSSLISPTMAYSAYTLYFDDGGISATNYYTSKEQGFAVRCVAN